MDRFFKTTGCFVLLYCLSAVAQAGNLCNLNCELSISFPGGGSIRAVDNLTITFGDGGLVDTTGSVTAYLAGQTLTLNAGESLDFEAGGSFDLGTQGNIEYSDLEIDSGGVFEVTAVGGDQQLQAQEGERLAFSGAITVIVNAGFLWSGTLEIGAGTRLQIDNPGDSSGGAATGCEISSSSGLSISATGSNPLTSAAGIDCTQLSTLLNSGSLTVDGTFSLDQPGIISTPGSGVATGTLVIGGGSLEPNIIQIAPGTLETEPEETDPATQADAQSQHDSTTQSDSGGSGGIGLMPWFVVLLFPLSRFFRRSRPL